MINLPFHRQCRFKVAAAFILLIGSVISISGIFSYQAAEKQFHHLLFQEFQSTRNVANNFLHFVEQTALITTRSVANNSALLNVLSGGDTKALAMKLGDLMKQHCTDIITLLDHDGNILASGNDIESSGESLLSFDFVGDIRGGKETVSAIVQDQGSFILYNGAALSHPATGEPVYVLAGYALNNSFVDHIRQNSHIEVSLVRERSIISTTLHSNGQRLNTLPIPFLEYEILLANPGQVMEAHFLGQTYLVSAERLPSMQTNMAGSMLLVHSLNELAIAKKQLFVRFALIFITSLVVGVTVIILLTRSMLRPVQQLIQTTKQISNGELDSRVKAYSKDEFGLLSEHFNIMTDAVQERDNALKQYSQDLEQKVAERTLSLQQKKEQLQRYITALDDIGVGLCVINADYRISTMNNTLIGWFGDHQGDMCYSTIMEQGSPCSSCRLQNVIEEQNTTHYQFTRSDGRTFEIVATPIQNSDGTISKMEIIRDITEQKAQEEQRLETSRQEEQLNKLQSLKTMAGAIAHRFNNAMMAVQGNLDLMTLRLPAGSDEYMMASDAAQAAKGASQVGSMMLSYVGQQPLRLQVLPFENLVKESISALKDHFQPPISLKFTPPDQPLNCSIDPQQIKEVIESILTNAFESIGDDTGTIEITFGADYFTVDSFPLSFQDGKLKDGNYVFCQIKDSGHGISLENLSRIFEPFYTTKFVGRGLGLALTIGIMQSHRGAITFDSTPEKGTTVRILLPPVVSTRQMPVSSREDLSETEQFSGAVLLADDEKMVLDVGKKMLELLGLTVHTAVDGQEAVDKICNQKIDFRAAVLDISMPEMDGLEAMKILREKAPALPILLSSGYFEDEFLFEKGKEGSPDGFLSKPFQLSDIRNSLKKLLS